MKPSVVNPRQLALDICYKLLSQGLSLNDLLDKHLASLANDRDRGFCSELCYGFCRYYYLLRAELKALMSKPLKGRDQDVQLILLLGLYQLRFMRVEDHAAVNESVKLLKKRNKGWAKGLVNAVLRSYIRKQADSDQAQQAELTEQQHRQAYPDWIRQKIAADWGDSEARILQAGNQRAPMVLRIDLSRISRSSYLQQLTDRQILAAGHPLLESAVILQSPMAVELLPGFSEGLVSVQDAAAQLAATLLDCEPGMRVLDACAAPGGKTLHILQLAQGLRLQALDKDAERLQRVRENMQRGGVEAELICADAADTESWFKGELFDRVLLDVPCSASGIMRRHPDIRLLRQPDDIAGLARQQRHLLDSLWPLLKPGGRLLYSTCSLFKDENEVQLAGFMASRNDCAERSLDTVVWGMERPIGRQILPGYDEMDGFYYACLEKKG